MQILKTASLTDARVATVAAGAFFDVTTDLGLPGDIAGKYFVLVDSTGKKAKGFVGAAGTGETLDSELVTNGTFTTDTDGWTPVNGDETLSVDTARLKIIGAAAGRGAYQTNTVTSGALYKVLSTATVGDVGYRYYLGFNGNSGAYANAISGSPFTEYLTPIEGNMRIGLAVNGAGYCFWDDISVKQVLTPSANGFTVVSSAGGSTKSFTEIETGFNPNSLATLTIYESDAVQVNHPVLARGTVAASALRFSNATGAYFVDTTDSTLAAALAAAVKHNDIVEVLDGSKRAIRFVAKSQGTGETLGAEEVDNNADFAAQGSWIFQEPATMSITGGQVVFTNTTTGQSVYQAAALADPATGKIFKIAWKIGSVTAGSLIARVTNLDRTGYERSSAATFTEYMTGSAVNRNINITAIGTTTAAVDSISVKQVLTPSTSGVFAQKYPGGADGFSSKDAAFNYNSATGFTWRVISSVPNGRTVYSNAITSSAMHASMVAGNAFFFHDSIDFSSFAVGPSGKYLIAMYDSAGRVAWGYGKAAGTGETKGDELFTNGDCSSDTGWVLNTGWSISGGKLVKGEAVGSYAYGYQNIAKTAGALYFGSFDVDSIALANTSLALTGAPLSMMPVDSITGTRTGYATQPHTGTDIVGAYISFNRDIATAQYDNFSLKRVLTPPATGLTITSTPDGETYNWAQITSGFDANKVTSVKIWRADGGYYK